MLQSFKREKRLFWWCSKGGGAYWGNSFGGLPSPKQLQEPEVMLSAQAVYPWSCLSSKRRGAPKGYKQQNHGGPSRQSLPPALSATMEGSLQNFTAFHKVANSAEGYFLSTLFSCQFPMRMRRKKRAKREIEGSRKPEKPQMVSP